MFGITKEQWINKNINIMIPNIFHKKHNVAVKQSTEINSNFVRAEKNILGVNYTGFLLLLKIVIRKVLNFGENTKYICWFMHQKINGKAAAFATDIKGIIRGVSSGIYLFK